MLNSYKISIGASRKVINKSTFPYLSYSVEDFRDNLLSEYTTPKLVLRIDCGDELNNYSKIQTKITLVSSFTNANKHIQHRYTTLNVTDVDIDNNLIIGYVENRISLLYSRFYLDENDVLIIGFNEQHCFNFYDGDVKVFVDYNNTKTELTCRYLDDFTLICKDYDRALFDNATVGNIKSIHRENWLVNADNLTFNLLEPSETINIPVSQTFGIGVNDFNVYTSNIVKSLIPKFRDTEKDHYTPVTKIDNNDYKTVTDYVFNLHFLQRESDKWKLKDNALWNGVNDDFTFDKNFFDDSEEVENYGNYSDLLGFLGYTNSEVKYSKSSLKKSFLRLSYYDSEDLETANLLAYYTIFIDSSKLLNKYNRHRKNDWYNDYNLTDNSFFHILGISTTGFPMKSRGHEDNSNRLDTRIEVSNKSKQHQSSEGLSLFINKQFNKDLEEKTVYLRIDFNHAKYGRTIPLMLPYNYKTEDVTKKGKIKSFQEIVDDHKNGGYNLSEFIKYYNIKLKVKNDFENNRYIYWLDRDTYNFDTPDDTSKVQFNLYEAKISSTVNELDEDEDLITTISDYALTYKQNVVDKDDDIMLFTPKVSYRLKQMTAITNKKVSDQSVISKQSKFNVVVNTGNLIVFEEYEDYKLNAQIGKQVVFKKNTVDYTIYKIVTKQTEDTETINASVVVSNKSGKIQVEHYKDFMRIINAQNSTLVATVQSKDVIDNTPYTSENILLELRRD